MFSKSIKMFQPEFNSHISAEARRNLQMDIQEDLRSSKFMQMTALEHFDPKLALEQFRLEMAEAEKELAVSAEFRAIRLIHVALLKIVNYFDKIRIDVFSVKKLEQLENLIKMNMRIYRVKTASVNYAEYTDMLIVVPNSYSGSNYVETIEHLYKITSSLYSTIDTELSKLNNLLSVYVSSFDKNTSPNHNFDYKNWLKTLKKVLNEQSAESLTNFKNSSGKNTDKLKNVISAFGEMEDVVNSGHKLLHFLRSIDLYKINSSTVAVNDNVNILLKKLDDVDEDIYIDNEADIKELGDVLFTTAKLIELFSSNYYRSITMVGALDNGLEFLARKL